jgi:hypothetical protein
MAVAMLYPEPAKGGRGKKNPVFNTGFSTSSVAHARTVLRVTPTLAAEVLAGTRALNDAYQTPPAARRGTIRRALDSQAVARR